MSFFNKFRSKESLPKFRVIIAGSRNFHDDQLMWAMMDKFLAEKKITHEIIVLSGCARGTDSLGEYYATSRHYKIKRYPAKWEKHGRFAGFIRNREMAADADALVAFWDGESRGTEHMISIAHEKGLHVRVVQFVPDPEPEEPVESPGQIRDLLDKMDGVEL